MVRGRGERGVTTVRTGKGDMAAACRKKYCPEQKNGAANDSGESRESRQQNTINFAPAELRRLRLRRFRSVGAVAVVAWSAARVRRVLTSH